MPKSEDVSPPGQRSLRPRRTSSEGRIDEVLWESPAYAAGLTAGSKVHSVNGRSYAAEELKQAVADAKRGKPIELAIEKGKQNRTVVIECPSGHRYPHLEPAGEGPRRLDDILAPLAD